MPDTPDPKLTPKPAAAPKKEGSRGKEAQLPAEIGELDAADEFLTAEELIGLSLFDSKFFEKEKNRPDFSVRLGTTVLRKCSRGRVICQQGDLAAFTAFFILSTEDVIALRQAQLKSIAELLAAGGGENASAEHQFLQVLSGGDLEQKRLEFTAEIEKLASQKELFDRIGMKSPELRPAAEVLLAGNQKAHTVKTGFFGRLVARLKGAPPPDVEDEELDYSDSISIDVPVAMKNRKGFKAELHEGTLFGEMSCLNRSPRSATVIATRDCYVLEMLRSVLDALRKDPAFKKRIDDYYRANVMEGHVRRLSIFGDLTDEEFNRLKDSVTLEDFPAGSVILEENDVSDAVFVVRSGLVKVLQRAGYSLQFADLLENHWSRFPSELAATAQDSSPLATAVWKALPAEVKALSGTEVVPAESRALVVAALNTLIHPGMATFPDLKINGRPVKRRAQLDELLDSQVAAAISSFPDEIESWSEYERRVFARYALEHVFPQGIPRRLALYGPSIICSYVGQGEVLGEIGVLLDQPRSATCVAYDHPDGYHQRLPDSRTGAVPSRVEVLRIPREAFQDVLQTSKRLAARVSRLTEKRQARSERAASSAGIGQYAHAAPGSDFERLGLVQGQQMMLIDLDRCTRCGACVEACIAAHQDGQSRLYLDGMRIEKYLVPLTCRKCLDPVCMIGCPVGSIQRGETGEIQIKNWCIGCSMCADQCPYGSIHMNEIEAVELTPMQRMAVPEGTDLKQVTERAVVCDMCSSLPSRSPSCVYACPHDAAMRVDGRDFFLSSDLLSPQAKAPVSQ